MEALAKPAPGQSIRRARNLAAVFVALPLIVLGVGFWYSQPDTAELSASTEKAPVTQNWILVQPRAVSADLDVVGTIAPAKSVPVLVPFDGVIKEKPVELGDQVKPGDVLAVLDTTEIAERYRDAQSTYLKAAMAAKELTNWEKSADVQRAKRELALQEGVLARLNRRVLELRALEDQGIVSRNEYDNLREQQEFQIAVVAGAEDELKVTLDRGNQSNQELLKLDLENAKARLSHLQQQMAGAEIVTTTAGILIRPPESSQGSASVQMEAGVVVSQGNPIFSVADTDSFVVIGLVDEIDINKVQLGQSVSIEIDAIGGPDLTGKITGVSAETANKETFSSAPSFEVRASFSPSDETLRQSIRVGMTARMRVQTYSNPNALIVPPQVIRNYDTTPIVRTQLNGEVRDIPVLLGRTFPEGIEIVSGVSSGSKVLLEARP